MMMTAMTVFQTTCFDWPVFFFLEGEYYDTGALETRNYQASAFGKFSKFLSVLINFSLPVDRGVLRASS